MGFAEKMVTQFKSEAEFVVLWWSTETVYQKADTFYTVKTPSLSRATQGTPWTGHLTYVDLSRKQKAVKSN